MQSKVLITEKLRKWIISSINQNSISSDLKEELIHYSNNISDVDCKKDTSSKIPFKLVRQMYAVLKKDKNVCPLYLHEILEGSEVELDTPPPKIKDPIYEARIEKLKIQQNNRDYERYTSNVNTTKREKDITVASELQNMNQQLIAVFNTVLTVIGSGVFTYKAVEYAMFEPNFQLQLISAMVVGTVVFIADLYFIMKSSL